MKYSVRDLLFDVINNVRPSKQRHAPHTVNDVSAPTVISLLLQAMNYILKPGLGRRFMYKCYLFAHFSITILFIDFFPYRRFKKRN